MAWHFISAQSLGAQSEQQDCLGAWTSADNGCVFVVLADGAGGHQDGQQAAQAAVEMARSLWGRAFLEKISRAAHEAVAALPHSPRTTWLALMAGGSQAEWVHSGDTRLYHFTSGRLMLRTLDHSLVRILAERGKSAAEAQADRHMLLQSLGGPDYMMAEHGSSPMGAGDTFLLCTDGVWSMLDDAHLLNLARSAPENRQRAAEELIAKAVHAGGNKADNASLWIVGEALAGSAMGPG
jgi:serine/threonine protein phosphatase PrpC